MRLIYALIITLTLSSEFSFAENCELKFGLFPYKSPKKLVEMMDPIISNMNKETGCKVLLVSSGTYEEFMAKAVSGDFDIMLPCTACYIRLMKQNRSYEAIAMAEPSFYGGVIVRDDSNIKTLSDLKGKKIMTTGKYSYAGYIFIKRELDKLNFAEGSDYTIHFSNKVDSIAYAVYNRKADVGAIRLDSLTHDSFKNIKNSFRILIKSEEIPQFPFIVKNSLKTDLKEKIKKVFLSSSNNKAFLEEMEVDRIVPANNKIYLDFAKKYKVE